jgi:N utilization substance protein B
MASNRHLGRIIALQTLYEQDFRRDCKDESFDLAEVTARNIDRYSKTVDDRTFIELLINGVSDQEKEAKKTKKGKPVSEEDTDKNDKDTKKVVKAKK